MGLDEPRVRAALAWIVGELESRGIAYQVVGGLAARAYGASRPIVDIDLYLDIEPAALRDLLEELDAPVTRAVAHHRDSDWDLTFCALDHEGVQVELAPADGAQWFDRRTGAWRDAGIDFGGGVLVEVLGVAVPVIPKSQLLDYKEGLGREVDRLDLNQIG